MYGCGCVQLAVLRKGLDLHGRRIAHTLKGMQQNLEGRLEEMVFEVFPERRKKVRVPLSMSSLFHATLLPPLSLCVPTLSKLSPCPPLQWRSCPSEAVLPRPIPCLKFTVPHRQSQSQTIGRGRRLTGKLKNKVNPTPETTMSPPNALQRSATARAPSRDSPKQPSPYMQRRLSSQQSTETKRLSGSGEREGERGREGGRGRGLVGGKKSEREKVMYMYMYVYIVVRCMAVCVFLCRFL